MICDFCDPAKPAPGSVEMDKAVLSCVMQAPEATMGAALELLQPEDFSTEACSLLFDILRGMTARSEPVDPVSVTSVLHRQGVLERMGGPAFISECYTASPNPGHVRHYAGQVLEASKRRQVIKAAGKLVTAALSADDWRTESSPLLRIVELAMENGKASEVRHIKAVAQDYIDAYGTSGPGGMDPPVNTGLAGLDKLLVGGVRREYVLIGGRQGHGKTLLGAQIGGKLAESGRAGLWVGWEMKDLQVFMRDVARESQVPLNQVMGRESFDNLGANQKVTRAITHMMEKWRLNFIDSPYITLESVASHARHLKRAGQLDYLTLDFLQLAPVRRAAGERRDEALCEASNFAERLRKELDITLIAMVQLNDDGLIRDARSILDAPQVFIRLEMDTAPEDAGDETVLDTGRLRVLKNRFGQCDRACPVVRNGPLQRFQDGEFKKQAPPSTGRRQRPRYEP